MNTFKTHLEKYKKGDISKAELKQLLDVLKNSENHTIFNTWAEEQWKQVTTETSENAFLQTKVWKEIKQGILAKETPVRKTRQLYQKIYKYAAVAAIALLISLALWQQKEPEFLTLAVASGEAAELFILPDRTKIWVNSASTVKYQEDFINNRNVVLQGEAYFEVQKNKQAPFRITFRDNQLKVTGTKFNISAYETDNQTIVSVKEGSVEVYNSRVDMTLLKKNNQLIIDNKLNKQEKNKLLFKKVTNWKEGNLNFDGKKLMSVLKVLERRYNVSFIVDQADPLLNNLVTVQYKPETTLAEILNGLTIITNINYEKIKENKYKINSRKP